MTAKPWTPGDVAEYDQLMAAGNGLLDKHVTKLREQIAAHGEQQGMANFSLYLTRFGDADLYLDLLLAALRRLTATDPL